MKNKSTTSDYNNMSPAANPDYNYKEGIVKMINLNNVSETKMSDNMPKPKMVSDTDYDGE